MVESQNGNYYLVEEVDALNTPRPIDTAPKDGTEFLARLGLEFSPQVRMF